MKTKLLRKIRKNIRIIKANENSYEVQEWTEPYKRLPSWSVFAHRTNFEDALRVAHSLMITDLKYYHEYKSKSRLWP